MSCVGAAPRAAVPVSNARAEASRRNGARSRGPKTAEGKARASRNALKHGLRAGKHVLLRDEDSDEFEALETALFEELEPEGALQGLLVGRMARAAWRLARAERIEVEMFNEHHFPGGSSGLAMIRDGNTSRSFETLVRYRGAAMAEFTRCLRTLKQLQAEAAAAARAAEAPARVLTFGPKRGRIGERAPNRAAGEPQPQASPIEPETRGKPKESQPNGAKPHAFQPPAEPRSEGRASAAPALAAAATASQAHWSGVSGGDGR
jgi:hypothetical protein